MTRAPTILEMVDETWHAINRPYAEPVILTGGTLATTILQCLIDLAYIEYSREIDFIVTNDGYAVSLGPSIHQYPTIPD